MSRAERPTVRGMSGRAPQYRTRGPQRQGPHDYNLSRWEDQGALNPDPRSPKSFVRRASEVGTGRAGIVKHLPSGVTGARRQRFHQEALYMRQMSGSRGILPVWDIDDARGIKPRWYVMPPAQLLEEQFSDTSTLPDVVAAIADIARTLAKLADQGTYHRDIKPANIFSYNGEPVLADFGIATFAHSPAGLTRTGEKLGPANFIAPEMRSARNGERGERADIYSLAKTLFVLALPRKGAYPPDGTHRVDAQEFSLGSLGSRGATLALGHVLEAATQFRAHDRLTMADFHAELRTWLDHYATSTAKFTPRTGLHFTRGWGPDISDRHRRDRESTRAMMLPAIRRIAEALTGDARAWSEDIDHGNGDTTLGDYDWPQNCEEGFIPDGGTIWLATDVHQGKRVVLQAVLDAEVCFIAESHQGGPPWTLGRQWGATPWQRARMPRTLDQVERLTDEILAWLAQLPLRSGEAETRDVPTAVSRL